MNPKRAGREFCFQYFFHLQLPAFENLKKELIQDDNQEELRSSITEFKSSTNTMLSDEVNDFVETQIINTLKNYDQVEGIISSHLKNWKISRLSKVDHTNLLLAVNELCFTKTAAVNVIINEAVELAKKFGTKESAGFVNGILDNIAKSHPA